MSVSPLSDAAVNRIVTAVNRKPTSLAHVADLLAEARFEYFSRCIPDIGHTASKQRAALASLEKAVSRFGSALNKYDNDGRPVWAFVESSAELNLSRLRDERRALNAQLPTTDAVGKELKRRIREIDQVIFLHEHSTTELLNRMLQGAAALGCWLEILFHQTRDGQLITSQHAEKGESHLIPGL